MIQIKAILIDIGGVLWHPKETPLSNSWAVRCGLSAEAFDQIVYNSEWGSQALVEDITAGEMWKNIGKQLGLSHDERNECENDYWAGTWDIDFLDYCRALKPNYKLGIVSDAESSVRERAKAWVNDTLFDVLVFSSEVGVCKPSPYIFRAALERLNVDASQTVFIDDRENNVTGANAVGIHAIHYKDRNQTLVALNEYISSERKA